MFFSISEVCLPHTLGRVHLERILDKTKLEQSWKETPVSLKKIIKKKSDLPPPPQNILNIQQNHLPLGKCLAKTWYMYLL